MPRAPFALGEKIELVIERLAFGGAGVGRAQGFVVFVPFSAPGDHLEVEITELKKNFASGRLHRILKQGQERTQPPCPVFGRCGGCTWQHVTYEEQLRQKQGIVEHLLSRSPYLKDTVVEPILPSPREWNYRNRIQLRAGDGRLGFFGRGSHEIIDTHVCPISDLALNEQFENVRKRYASSARMTKIELLLDESGTVHESLNQAHGEEFGFSQVNEEQNLQLMEMLIAQMQQLQPTEILDLYCGKGNFSFPLAQAFPQAGVCGVEFNPAAIGRAKTRLQASPELQSRLEFRAGDVAQFLKKHKFISNTVVVIDPPRIGCEAPVIEALRSSKSKIIYISCNPTTFVRDAEKLTQNQAFRLTYVRPFDMFPQTDHIGLIGMFV